MAQRTVAGDCRSNEWRKGAAQGSFRHGSSFGNKGQDVADGLAIEAFQLGADAIAKMRRQDRVAWDRSTSWGHAAR